MNELDKLDKQADILLNHLASNGKKILQHKLKTGTLDIRRLDATMRITHELKNIALIINELWEYQDREAIVGN
jgi:hypothetical protein